MNKFLLIATAVLAVIEARQINYFEASAGCATSYNQTVCNGTTTDQVKMYYENVPLGDAPVDLTWNDGDAGILDMTDFPDNTASITVQIGFFGTKITGFVPQTFQKFTQLASLTFSNCPFTTLDTDIFSNTQLEMLMFINVPLETIEPKILTSIPQLGSLQIFNSQLKRLAPGFISIAPQLSAIQIENSNIAEIDMKAFLGLDGLFLLDLSKGKLETITADQLIGTERTISINLGANQITSLPDDLFIKYMYLTDLRLQSNQLTTTQSCYQAENLQQLNLNSNQIETVSPFETCNALIQLQLSDNKIKQFDPSVLQDTPALLELYLANNQLVDLDVSSLLTTLKQLVRIDLSGNPWICDNLQKMLDTFTPTTVEVNWGEPNYNVTNINGIPCTQ